MIKNFKVSGFKVFGDIVELTFEPGAKNFKTLGQNIIEIENNKKPKKLLKSLIVYGGNNVGKSSLLDALVTFKKIFDLGNLEAFPFEIYKNFSFKTDGIIRFEITFISSSYKEITYGIEFMDKDFVGEYVFVDDILLFSRNLDNTFDGILLDESSYYQKVKELKRNKLIVPFFLEFIQKKDKYTDCFEEIDTMFSKIIFYNNGANIFNFKIATDFVKSNKKMDILNTLITSSSLFMHSRGLMSEEELYSNDLVKDYISILNDIIDKSGVSNIGEKNIFDYFRITSTYLDSNNKKIIKPSFIFDSIGTNKYITMSMYIINAMLENQTLLIDEFDSSLHYKLTRALSIFINSNPFSKAQFILSTHDVKLLSPVLFRKDQIYFINRYEKSVEMVSLDMFKSNSEVDVRSNSNYEKMYVEGKIVDLPYTDIYSVIKEFEKNEKKA